MNNTLNQLLSELADEIDITDSQEGAIKRAYNSVADWLNQSETKIAKHSVHIFPQGSMMYGTAVKPINEDDYDIDLVCEFTKLTKNLEAEYVKKSVGMRIQESDRYKKMLQAEGRRCWTLQYSESLNFHMDILPAIPFHKDYTTDRKLYDAYNNINFRQDLALLATNKDRKSSKYEYIPTNPRGYAEWFRERMQANSKRSLFDSIERVPTYPKKTILQKAIQLLKRYRDVYFANKDDDLKPISMIITTLVAKCYNGEQNLYDFICKALTEMSSFIERNKNGQYIIKNPVMSNENFADKWGEVPRKAESFFEWNKQAAIDFKRLSNLNTYTEYDKVFKEMFSQKPVDRLMQKYEDFLEKEKEIAATLVEEEKPISLITLEKIPHRVAPPWELPRGFRVTIEGQVSYNGGHTYQRFQSGQVLPKQVDLQFFPLHSITAPYKVKWQITNTGYEARMANGLRGNKFEDGELMRAGILSGKKESTSYTGTHYIWKWLK